MKALSVRQTEDGRISVLDILKLHHSDSGTDAMATLILLRESTLFAGQVTGAWFADPATIALILTIAASGVLGTTSQQFDRAMRLPPPDDLEPDGENSIPVNDFQAYLIGLNRDF
jgi:hypothetical protein